MLIARILLVIAPSGFLSLFAPVNASETESESAAGPALWMDVDCDDAVTARDSQALLRDISGAGAMPIPDGGLCYNIRRPIGIETFGNQLMGDSDCDGSITSRDSQSVLRYVLDQEPLPQNQGCPAVGAPVVLGEPLAPVIDLLAVDTVVDDANTADSVGPVDPCANIDTIGDLAVVDIVVEGVPATDGSRLAAVSATIEYDRDIIRIVSLEAPILPEAFTGFSDPLPDSDGAFQVEAVTFAQNSATVGVLIRLVVETVGTGVTAIMLEDAQYLDGEPNLITETGFPFTIAAVADGVLAVGQPCPQHHHNHPTAIIAVQV